ncbi:hypothetical protein LRS06_16065 [Hymenobacter sp. J193]|uniref:hypothetical protein n=1 Tax=Hymenobacter sp. J193 TaxID=2898429 RepID=UPI002151F8A4|nr:hypothetical protein [Hymenobacter sp. J193]MCR5889253.1 hypothetical protein [Hymenobacter sp. J193]
MDNITIWIAILSFASSLVVVLITSCVTLVSKRIDAQQKRDEHLLALQKIYLTRKIEVAEKTVGRWNLHISKLNWAHNYYSNLDLSKNVTDTEFQIQENIANVINAKVIDIQFSSDDYQNVYFDNIVLVEDSNIIVIALNKVYEELNSLIIEISRLAESYLSEEDVAEKRIILNAYNIAEDSFEAKRTEYLRMNIELKNIFEESAKHIRQQLLASYDPV